MEGKFRRGDGTSRDREENRGSEHFFHLFTTLLYHGLRHRDFEPGGFGLEELLQEAPGARSMAVRKSRDMRRDASSRYEDVKEVLGLDHYRVFLYEFWLQRSRQSWTSVWLRLMWGDEGGADETDT